MQILLVRLRLIGDVVFTTPAIRALRRRFPEARLTYLVEESAAPVVAGNPHLDEVIAIPRTRGLRRVLDDWKVARALRARRFDVVVDFHGGPRGSWLTWLTGAKRRIGYTVVGRRWMYTTAVPRPRELRPRHSVENQWDLLQPLGIGGDAAPAFHVEMPVDAAVAAGVARRLAQAGVDSSHELVVVHVSSNSPFRRWPAESFAAAMCSGPLSPPM